MLLFIVPLAICLAVAIVALVNWQLTIQSRRTWVNSYAGLEVRYEALKAEASAYAAKIEELVNNNTGLQALLDERQTATLETKSLLEIAQARLDEELAIKAAAGQQIDALKSSLRYYQDSHKKEHDRVLAYDQELAQAKAQWQDREGMMKAQKDAADAELGKMMGLLVRFRKRLRDDDRWLETELGEYRMETREVRVPLEQPSLVAALAQAAEVSPAGKE